MRKILPLLLVVAVVLTSCGSSSDDDFQEVESGAELDSTTTTVDPWAVPSTIDAAYVQRVVQEIENVRGQVRYDVWTNHQLDQTSKQRLAAIFDEPYLSFAIADFSESSTKDHPEFKNVPDGAKATVKELVTARPDCIYVVVNLDANGVRLVESETYNFGKTLKRAPTDSHNATGWRVVESRSVDGYDKDDLCIK